MTLTTESFNEISFWQINQMYICAKRQHCAIVELYYCNSLAS